MPRKLNLFHLKAPSAAAFVARRTREPAVIFDVGANVGQSAKSYLELFPGSRILCFEPVPETFSRLKAAVGDQPGVQCFRLALSDHDGTGRMSAAGASTGNALLPETAGAKPEGPKTGGTKTGGTVVEVPLVRGEAICREQDVTRIRLLKIDSEGHDLKILAGFLPLLAEHRIDFVEVEASMSRHNAKHVPFDQFIALFGALDYRLVGLFDQVLDRSRLELRRANPLFGSPRSG